MLFELPWMSWILQSLLDREHYIAANGRETAIMPFANTVKCKQKYITCLVSTHSAAYVYVSIC